MINAKKTSFKLLVTTLIFINPLCWLYGQSYENLVFEGAGVRGVAYVGAIKELEEQNILPQIRKVGGTSAGAIAALTLALGYNSKEIEEIIYSTQLQTFNDGQYFFVGGIYRVYHNYGWYKGEAFTHWIEQIIEQKTGDPDITFITLHERGFRDLYVTGTSLNRQRLIVFSHETYPNMKVKDALRISISIPLYFEAVYIDENGRIIDKKNPPTGNFDVMVDGGFTGNYPITVFDNFFQSYGQVDRINNPCTLGLRVDTPDQIDVDKKGRGLAPVEISHIKNYIGAFYNYGIENLNRSTLTPNDWSRTVSISSGTIGPRIRKLSTSEKELLITHGQTAMKEYLQSATRMN